MKHIMAILIAVFSSDYHEKTVDFENLVTVCSRSYYVYRYEGNLNGIENAVVQLSYPKDAFLNPKALRVFISTGY